MNGPKSKLWFREFISIEEARTRFPGAMEHPNAEGFGDDPNDVLYIRRNGDCGYDGKLVIGNDLDRFYDVWTDGSWKELYSILDVEGTP